MSAFAHRGKADIVAGIAALASFSEKGVVLTGFALAHRSVSNTPGSSQNLQFLPKVSPQYLKNSRFAEKGSRDQFDSARPTWQWRFSKIWNATIFATAYGADVRFRG
jgi:hypothetical protein